MKLRYGLTEAELKIDENDETFIHVTHAGNMGNRLPNVIDNVKKIFGYGENVEFMITNMNGSPDYYYVADFYIL